jgi:hypothetical protein
MLCAGNMDNYATSQDDDEPCGTTAIREDGKRATSSHPSDMGSLSRQ